MVWKREWAAISADPDIGEEEQGDDSEVDETHWSPDPRTMSRILPYRAGYEAEDRRDIQNALARRIIGCRFDKRPGTRTRHRRDQDRRPDEHAPDREVFSSSS